jgi:hypothetical protein
MYNRDKIKIEEQHVSLQESSIGYDRTGVGRIIMLALMGVTAVVATISHAAARLLPERLARRIDYRIDVLRYC